MVISEDGKTKEKLSEVEFELLDENKEVVYAELKTDKEGKLEITHLVPGKYYLRETKAKQGYKIYDKLIEVQVAMNEELIVTVTNNQEDTKAEVKTSKKVIGKEELKQLPVTGM